MLRTSTFNLKCPPLIQERINKALETQFYLLSQGGPLAFVLGTGLNGDKNCFKVALGTSHFCSCHKFKNEGNLCIHVLWVLLKVFHLSPSSPLLYQFSLVDREIEELLQMARKPKEKIILKTNDIVLDDEQVEDGDFVSRRDISSDDICAICQDELLDSKSSSSSSTSTTKTCLLMHCKLSCGNSIHSKCLKILIQHQKSLGKEEVKCPYCRNEFGKIENLEHEMENMAKSLKKASTKRQHTHYGMECHHCHTYPIKGNIQKCKTCSSLYLCETCFKDGAHDSHAFVSRSSPHATWEARARAVAPILPSSMISDFQTRELTEADYETLLALDAGPQQQGSIPLHIVNTFPVIKLVSDADKKKVRLDQDGKCKVCAIKIRHGELVRQIPCGHGFHQSCIDKWLIHSRSTCPTCGSAAYSSLGNEDDEMFVATPMDAKYQPKKKEKRKEKKVAKKTNDSLQLQETPNQLMITGLGSTTSTTTTSTRAPSQPRRVTNRSIILPPLPTTTHSLSLPFLNIASAAEDLVLGNIQRTINQSQAESGPSQPVPKRKESSLKGSSTFGRPSSYKRLIRPTADTLTVQFDDLFLISTSRL